MVSPKNSVTRKNVPRYYTLNGQVRYIYLTYKYGVLLKSKSKFKPALRNDLPIKKILYSYQFLVLDPWRTFFCQLNSILAQVYMRQ